MKKMRMAQSLVEYGLILALVSVVAIAALQLMGGKIQKTVMQGESQLENDTKIEAESYCKSIKGIWDASAGICNPAKE